MPSGGTHRRALTPPGFRLGLLLIVAVGVAIRVIYTVVWAPWPPHGITDEFYYSGVPVLLAHGHGFVSPTGLFTGQFIQTAGHPPFYTIVLAGLAKLGGTGEEAQRLLGSLFGAVTIATVGVLGRDVGDDMTGLLAAGLAAIYPILIGADGALMSESLYGMLAALSLLGTWLVVKRPNWARAAALGVALGLAALTRGEGVALFVVTLLYLAFAIRRVVPLAVMGACFIVVLAPWTIRNAVVFHRFVPIANDSGSVVAGANCHLTYYGSEIGGWDVRCVRAYPGNEAQVGGKQSDAGISYARHHLLRLPIVMVARWLRVWSFYAPRSVPEGRSGALQDVGVLMYYALLIPAAFGVVAVRRRRQPVGVLVIPLVVVSLTAVLTYGFVRFREPADVALVILGAAGLQDLARRVKLRRATGRPGPHAQPAA